MYTTDQKAADIKAVALRDVDQLLPGQFAIIRGTDIARDNNPTITFTGDASSVTMTIVVSFRPDQFNATASSVNITVGQCAVFQTNDNVLNGAVSVTFPVGANDKIDMQVGHNSRALVVPTTGDKGNHGS